MKSLSRKTAVVATGAALAFSLAACGSGGSSGGGSSENASKPSQEQTTGGAATSNGGADGQSTSPANAQVGGSFSGTVDDQTLTIDQVGVSCGPSADGGTSVAAASTSQALSTASTTASAVIDGTGSVSLVTSTSVDGETFNYTKEWGAGDAEAVVEGSTYTVTGNIGASASDSSATKPFSLTFTCP